MVWMVRESRLDEAQQNLLRRWASMSDKPIWIEGFAGSGKTVLLIHAAQKYLQKNPESKICVVVFTHALKDMIETGISPEYQHKVPVMTYLYFVNRNKANYDLVVIDEVQDVPESILKAIRRRTKKILVAGDDAQSIYESGCRAEQIESVLEPERMKLPMVYRLTRKIINVVKNILPDTQMVTATSGRMQEIQVTLAHMDSYDTECFWVWDQAKRLSETSHPSVVVLPSHDEVLRFLRFVAKNEGIEIPTLDINIRGERLDYTPTNKVFEHNSAGACLQYLGNSHGSLTLADSRPVVYVMTYHSIKGLDFRTVFLPLLNSDTFFWKGNTDIDRRLFFVGATRSRRDLFMSYSSLEPHQYIKEMPQEELHKMEINKDDVKFSDDDDYFF